MFLGIVINYVDRVNISHAIVLIAAEMHLTPMEQGVIMSAFSWGYVLFMLVGGWLVDRFGPRLINALSCFVWSVFTAMGAVVSGFLPFLVSRFLVGMGESPIFPGNASVVRRWFPLHERGKATALFDVGSYVGAAIVAPIIIFLMLSFGWRLPFFIFAVVGVMWSIIWFLYYRDPEESKRVSISELICIREDPGPIAEAKSTISIWFPNPAITSSRALSNVSQMRCSRPSSPVVPIYMPGRLRTGSRPSRTVMLDAL